MMDKVYSAANLRAGWQRVAGNDGAAGVDRQMIADFERGCDGNLAHLAETLRDGSYRPRPVRRVHILLSNIYLSNLDHHLAEASYEMVRYADDFVILCRTREEAERALVLVQAWVADNGLTLHPTKTHVVDATTEGFDFLGYRFVKHRRFPRKKSLAKFKDAIRDKTHRAHGYSLRSIIAEVNLTLRGWFEYFQHSVANVFTTLDGWVRMRLRSILHKRLGLRGVGRGADHHRWPNHFFTEHGLFSLIQAHATLRQSLTG